MKTNALYKSNISDTARTNSQLAKLNADPVRFYDGHVCPNEDSADYVKLGAIKAVRLG